MRNCVCALKPAQNAWLKDMSLLIGHANVMKTVRAALRVVLGSRLVIERGRDPPAGAKARNARALMPLLNEKAVGSRVRLWIICSLLPGHWDQETVTTYVSPNRRK